MMADHSSSTDSRERASDVTSMPGARPRARINVDAIRRDAGVQPEQRARPRSAAPNLRMVLLSGATRLPLDEYLTYVCGVLFGLAFAAFAGILLQLYFEWLEWLQNEWFQISGVAFAVPVAAPHHLNFVQVISVAVGIVLASLRVGLVRCARLALQCLAIHHCSEAHDDFDNTAHKSVNLRTAAAGGAGADAGSGDNDASTQLVGAVRPFFRFGASLGLAFSALASLVLVRLIALLSLTAAVFLAYYVFRRGRRRLVASERRAAAAAQAQAERGATLLQRERDSDDSKSP